MIIIELSNSLAFFYYIIWVLAKLELFYNCLSSNGREKFKPLIEKYAIFNNLRVELLATDSDKELYASKFKDNYAFSQDENGDMDNEYKKGAFVFNKNED